MSEIKTFRSDAVARALKHSPAEARYFARDMAMLSVTAAIINEMESQGVTRTQLAERVGCTKAFVSQVLNGSRNMTLRTIADLAWALGKEVHGVALRDIGTTTVSRDAMNNHLDHWSVSHLQVVSSVSGTLDATAAPIAGEMTFA